MDEGGRDQQSSSFTPHRDEDYIDSNKNVLIENMHTPQESLSYTFFLIPEISLFQLTGEMVELLPEWLKQICLSHGWKLEFVTIDSKYFQWGVSVSPVVATGKIIQEIRSRLCEQIVLASGKKMPPESSADLWARGYLLLYGLHLHPVEIIDQYIRLIQRQRQRP